VANGWTIVADVTTSPPRQGDLTSGYWWSEQMKYWYLMFADYPRFDYRHNHLSTEGNVLRGLLRRRRRPWRASIRSGAHDLRGAGASADDR
jgi:mannosyl-oligosaccharide alpha-1,2-mannosidase